MELKVLEVCLGVWSFGVDGILVVANLGQRVHRSRLKRGENSIPFSHRHSLIPHT
jgi:hypothetical protein